MLVTDTCLTSYNYFGVTHPICITCGNIHMAAHLLPLSHHIFSSRFSSQLSLSLSHSSLWSMLQTKHCLPSQPSQASF